MQNTCVAILSYSGAVSRETRVSLAAIKPKRVISREHISDVALARSVLLTAALDKAQDCDVVLCLDDDICFAPEHAQQVVDLARGSGMAASGVYLSADGYATAVPVPQGLMDSPWLPDGLIPDPCYAKRTHFAGGGCLAVPMARLRMLAELRGRVRWTPQLTIVPFSTSGPNKKLGTWLSDDFSLSLALGGVLLAEAPFGHLKRVPLWPDAESLRAVVSQEAMPAVANPVRVERQLCQD